MKYLLYKHINGKLKRAKKIARDRKIAKYGKS